jgi:predicted MFS family arabinose efflux permease
VIAALLLATSSFTVAQAAAISVLPAIQADLGASTAAAGWVFTLTLIVATVTAPLLGRLGDTYGRRRVLVAVTGAVAIGSAACALAPSLGVLLAGRALQGAGGATFGLALGLVREQAPPERLERDVAAITASLGVGVAVGVAAGGWITETYGYAAVFWCVAAMALLGGVGVLVTVHPTPGEARRAVDWPGAVLLTCGLSAVMLAISDGARWGWTSAATLTVAALGTAALAAWAAIERRRPEPLVDVRSLRRRTPALVNAACVLVSAANFCAFFLVPLLAARDLRLDATRAGLLFSPYGVAMVAAGVMVGALGLAPRRALTGGLVLATAALAGLLLSHHTAFAVASWGGVLGVAMGAAFAGMSALLVADAPAGETATAIGVNAVMRTAGGALGAQLAAVTVERGFDAAFAVGVALAGTAWLLACQVRSTERPSATASAASSAAAGSVGSRSLR